MRFGNLILVIAVLITMLSCASPTLPPTSTPEPISTTTPTPTPEATSTITATPTPEPMSEPTPASTPDPTSDPTPASTPEPTSDPTPTPTTSPTYIVNGFLETIEGVPVIRVWGSNYEMGYAYGYLFADQMVEYVQASLDACAMDPTNVTYEGMVSRLNRYTLWSDASLEEMRGNLDGIEAALGGLPVVTHHRIEAGSAQLNLDMLLVCNCLGNILNVEQGCSGFAAWGEATGDGKTMAGGNVDLPDRSGASLWVLVVRKPDDGLSTVCLHVYGAPLGTLFKGMNETGLVLSNQGAYGIFPSWAKVAEAGYTDVILRDILEQVPAGPDMVTRITEIFRNSESIFSGTFLFAQKHITGEDLQADQMAMVIEKDPYGFDVRLPSHNNLCDTPLQEAIFATNHFFLRQVPDEVVPHEDSVTRYTGMVAAVIEHVVSGIPGMQIVLQGASVFGSMHSIYLEPDSLTVHMAYGTAEGPPSPSLTPVTFTWDDLFAPIPE